MNPQKGEKDGVYYVRVTLGKELYLDPDQGSLTVPREAASHCKGESSTMHGRERRTCQEFRFY